MGLEVQGQGASTFGFWCKLSSWVAASRLLAVYSHGFSSVHAQRKRELSGVSSSSCKDNNPLKLGHHPYYYI